MLRHIPLIVAYYYAVTHEPARSLTYSVKSSCFSEDQNSVIQNILLSQINRDVMRWRSTAVNTR